MGLDISLHRDPWPTYDEAHKQEYDAAVEQWFAAEVDDVPGIGYRGFMRFRELLAEAEHIDLDQMEGYAERDGHPWRGVESTLVPLFDHSDCDGELTPEEAAMIAPRLRQIVETWEQHRLREWGMHFADKLDRAAREGLRMVFR